MAVEFRLLGEVDALVAGHRIDLGHARQRCVLAVLLVEVNRVVSVDQLIDRVWADRAPYRARNAVLAYLSRLRQRLAGADVRIARGAAGYALSADPLSVDLHRFRHLVAKARTAGPGEAVALYGQALDLWLGEPFATVDTPWFDSVRTSLHAERLAVVLDRNDAALRVGRHAELLAELAGMARAHPLDERLAGQLMLAQFRSGRQADALGTYQQVRTRLLEELGADPGAALRGVHQEILAGDAGGTGGTGGPAVVAVASGEPPDAPHVTIRLAGPLTVDRGGRSSGGPGIGSRKARVLLAILAAHRDRRLGSDEIVELLWSGRVPSHPVENLAVLVSRLRAVLGTGAIAGGRGGYRLAGPPAVRVDLDEAAALTAESARQLDAGSSKLALSAAARALELLEVGSVLEDEDDYGWVGAARAEGAELLRGARHAVASAALASGDAAVARAAADAAVTADPLDEAACRLLMAAHHAAGEQGRAVVAYDRLRRTLAEELGVDPSPDTREVHLAVLREQQPRIATRHPPTTGRASDELAGRAVESARLSAAWSAAVAGTPGVMVLVGEAGIGKTRLATQLAEVVRATGGDVLQARCYAAERSLLLQPLVDALGPVVTDMSAAELVELLGSRADTLAGLLPEAARSIGVAPGVPAPAEVERRRVFEVVAMLLRGLAARRPLLLLVDDLHNAGLATAELLHYLARHLTGAPVLVLATVRGEEGAEALAALAGVSVRLDVGPLPEPAVAALAAAAGRAEQAAEIVRRTRGHTLFVVEMLRGLAAGEPGLPESLREAVLTRLSRAGPAIEEMLRAAAVLGATVDPTVVAGLLEQPVATAVQRCEQAAAARLLVVADRRYEFANDLLHELLYATTPAPTRVSYHRRAADLLTDRPEAVAEHAAAVGDRSRAARAWLQAGEDALRRFAATDAEALLGKALRAAEHDDDAELAARALVARGRAREAMAAFDAALADLQAGVEHARRVGDRRLEMIGRRELAGDVPMALGRSITESVGHLTAGLRIAESLGDRGMQADLLARLAVIGSNRLDFTDALAQGRRAATAGRAAGDTLDLAKGLDGLRNPLAYLGEVGSLAPVVDELEPLLRSRGDLWRLQWTVFESAFVPLAAGDWDGAARRIDEAVEIARRSGYDTYRPFFLAHRGWLERLRGRHDDALRHGREAHASPGAAPQHWAVSGAGALLAGTLLDLGRAQDAVDLLTTAVSFTEGQAEAHRLRCLAPLAEATGSPEVLAEADGLLAAVSAPAGSAWLLGADAYLSVARAWLARREPERARTVLAPLLTAAARVPWPGVLAPALLVDARALTALGDAPAARAALRRAAELAIRHDMPEIERRATNDLGCDVGL